MTAYQSWGNYPSVNDQRVHHIHWRCVQIDFAAIGEKVLPYGQGRSYGDCCLNSGGTLLVTSNLNRFIAFDSKSGSLQCEAGLTLAEILEFTVPQGWFLPVTPGTKFVSVGGAIANDVHGKNHHRAGTFGRYLRRFELLRSNGVRLICSVTDNSELYRATIGGLGLTGLVLWAEIQLVPILGPYIELESIKFANLAEFFEISQDSDARFEHTVAWVDCLARGEKLGRGIFVRGKFTDVSGSGTLKPSPKVSLTVPVDAPNFLLNKLTVKAFNLAYYYGQLKKIAKHTWHYNDFFYPLDSLRNWNRIYGNRGFFQYQCVVPQTEDHRAIEAILRCIAASGLGSFLAVLKVFGDAASPGIMSFPRPGITLALDFPNRGHTTLRLLEGLDQIVRRSGGAVYPAKDARMSSLSFKTYYPLWQEFALYLDPRFSSSFWRRVTAE